MLTSLVVRRFRNLGALEQRFEAGANVLLAGTGAGKTSVLEAIYLVATTRSFRTEKLAECRGHEVVPAEGFLLAAETGPQLRHRLELAWQPAAGLSRTSNGESARLVDYLGVLPVLLWRTEESAVLVGAPALRRRWLDRALLTRRPPDLEHLRRFRSALDAKRRVLQTGQGGLEAWNEVLARASAQVTLRRAALVAELNRELAGAPERAGLRLAQPRLEFRSSPPLGEGTHAVADLEAAVGALRAELERHQARERSRGQPEIGAHRDRLELRMGGRRLGAVASAGERKACGLLLLGALRRCLDAADRPPVLLLDDVDAELDRETFERLYRALVCGGQLFLTSNRPEVFSGLPVGSSWRLSGGRLERR